MEPRTFLGSLLRAGSTRRRATPSPLARHVPVGTPMPAVGTRPQQRLLGPGLPSCGVTSPTGAHNNLLPVHSHAQSSLRQAHHVPPHLLCPQCVYCVSIPSHGMGAIWCGVWWVA